jgi:hypothetical protein
MRNLQQTAAALVLIIATVAAAHAQKSGGILQVYHRDSPASMSISRGRHQLGRYPDDGCVQQSRSL